MGLPSPCFGNIVELLPELFPTPIRVERPCSIAGTLMRPLIHAFKKKKKRIKVFISSIRTGITSAKSVPRGTRSPLRKVNSSASREGMKAKVRDDLPIQSLLSEIESFRTTIHQTLSTYEAKLNEELTVLKTAVEGKLQESENRQGQLRDLRDMLTVLRTVDVKPEKGRRKDIKKLEGVVEDLKIIAENW